jgi:oligopeptide/dipeptide ABC transporter ATP-binding protein
MKPEETVVEVRDLKMYFPITRGLLRRKVGDIKAVDDVSFEIKKNETLGLVGESGCGKSITALSIMRLVPSPPGRISGGRVLFRDRDLLQLSEEEMRRVRGNRISMVFQEPMTSLNPVFTVGDQIMEAIRLHQGLKGSAARDKAVEALRQVGLPDPADRLESYPHQLSGGMRQRVMIAMAISCGPELLIADEPTTALDVTIQAQILDLLRNLRSQMNTSIILITHDLGIVAEMCERVAVMYAGRIVEETDVVSLFAAPKHPYTVGLIGSVPVLGQVRDKLHVIPGSVPNLIDLPPGCKFAPRCQTRIEQNLAICTQVEPELLAAEPRHTVRCWLYQ